MAEDGESFFERMEKLAEKISKTFGGFSFEKTKERFDGFLQKLKEGFLNTGNFGKGFSNLIEVFQKLESSLMISTSGFFFGFFLKFRASFLTTKWQKMVNPSLKEWRMTAE